MKQGQAEITPEPMCLECGEELDDRQCSSCDLEEYDEYLCEAGM